METYCELKALVENPRYPSQRLNCPRDISDDIIDAPIINLIHGFNRLPYCFTLQSCYGHFVYNGQKDLRNLEPLPAKGTYSRVEYRIAYIAFCIENSPSGRALFEEFKKIPAMDSQNVQFCCAEWFWERYVNSYALQVEPDRFKHQDTAIIGYDEALHIEKIRNEFFIRLHTLLGNAT